MAHLLNQQVTNRVTALPDDYFTPTAADLRAAQTQLAARTQALTNAPLKLKATREAEEKAKQDRWPTVRVSCLWLWLDVDNISDNNPDTFYGSNTTREDFPILKQDQNRLCIC